MFNIQVFRKGNRGGSSTLGNGLVSYWKFNESAGNAADSAGPNTLTNNGSATYVPGILGNGVNLVAASSQYMSISNGSQVGLGFTSSMSVSMWVKLTSASTPQIFVAKYDYDTGENRAYQFYYEDYGGTKLSAAFSSSGTTGTETVVRLSQTLSAGVWYHIVFVYDAPSGSCTTYVNGASIGTGTGLVNSIFDSPESFRVGANHAGIYMNGIMDELGMWNRTLISEEVVSLYNAGNGLSYPF